MSGKFVIDKASNGQFYFNLRAGNGEPILRSELYVTRASAEHGIESVRKNAPLDERYQRKDNTKGEPMFTLKAGNHEVIGVSESYSSASARDNGIESVKKNAPDATVQDNTK
ncbi:MULTISPECIES: YegP family protein [unclassified Caballeronia]|uniref:YegP family protein n=1 Tax=unclassified Caballeronia TaxID=2646786 RepID=UPI002858CD09|nr:MULTISPECIES: YegP family protein [unclassified Caballeronia]MDR5749552.1 YegP family protein [Caballeronia sp. LZ024]MDR5843318.1 YegP family protein [Caballeronia sp. LZ031]